MVRWLQRMYRESLVGLRKLLRRSHPSVRANHSKRSPRRSPRTLESCTWRAQLPSASRLSISAQSAGSRLSAELHLTLWIRHLAPSSGLIVRRACKRRRGWFDAPALAHVARLQHVRAPQLFPPWYALRQAAHHVTQCTTLTSAEWQFARLSRLAPPCLAVSSPRPNPPVSVAEPHTGHRCPIRALEAL